MFNRFTIVPIILLVILLAGCSSRSYVIKDGGEQMDAVSMRYRLYDVANPLLVATADWCPFEREPTYGFLLTDERQLQSRGREIAGRKAVVSYVHPRSPGARAGLAPGDQVTQVNAQKVTEDGADNIMQLVRRLTYARIQPLQLEVMRAGDRLLLSMMAVPACQFSLQVIESDQINGISNGRQVAVTTGAIKFFLSDDELAWVLAHEIAHNVLSHVDNAKLRAMLNAFLSATVGTSAPASATPRQRSLEAQADYVGVYIMARAGYDLQAVRQVWRRLERIETQQAWRGHNMATTHPTTAERLAAFEETLKEIDEKRRQGESLKPVLAESQ